MEVRQRQVVDWFTASPFTYYFADEGRRRHLSEGPKLEYTFFAAPCDEGCPSRSKHLNLTKAERDQIEIDHYGLMFVIDPTRKGNKARQVSLFFFVGGNSRFSLVLIQDYLVVDISIMPIRRI